VTTPKGLFGDTPALSQSVGLVDVIDRLLDRGAVVVGQSTISVAGVDLVYLRLQLLLSSVETLRHHLALPTAERTAEEQLAREDRAGIMVASCERSSPSPIHRSTQTPAGGSVSVTEGPSITPSTTIEESDEAPRTGAQPNVGSESRPEQGLAQLVLALVELLRQILERQAVRRMEGGSLSVDEVERMGLALLELESKMEELRQVFGLTKEDLNLNLGPILGDSDGK